MDQNRDVIIISFTGTGTKQNRELCKKIRRAGLRCAGYTIKKYADSEILPLPAPVGRFAGEAGEGWGSRDLVFIGAAGIAVRAIAPWIKDKFTDPAVLVMDEKGRYVIPILSGHVGGAAALADRIAALTGAQAVHTTATDVQGKFAVDVFARKNHLLITDRDAAKRISAAILDGEKAAFFCDVPESDVSGELPEEIVLCESGREAEAYRCRIIVTEGKEWDDYIYKKELSETILILKPRNIIAGIGCRKGIPVKKLEDGLQSVLEQHGLDVVQVEGIASIELKKDEPAILALTEKYRIPFVTYSTDELREISGVSAGSDFVKKITGVDNVCERAVLKYLGDEQYGSCDGKLIQEKCIRDSMTAALAMRRVRIEF